MPLAVDTNVLVRALVDDGTEQTQRAVRRFMSEDTFVSVTVLLETEWVLRSKVGLDEKAVNRLFAALAGYEHVEFEDRARILKAIAAHGQGLDFADALHLFAASECRGLCSFDADFRRRAKRLDGAIPVMAP